MKNPTFLGVNPWFFNFLSFERAATISLAVQLGCALTYTMISDLNLFLLACF